MKRTLPVILISGLVLGLVVTVLSDLASTHGTRDLAHRAPPSTGAPAALAPPAATERVSARSIPEELDHQALAASLHGTEVDGVLAADAQGDLVLDLGVRDYFDYFLSVADEVPLSEVVAFMDAYARRRLPARAADQLMALLDDYMDYQQSAHALMQEPLLPAELQTREYYLQALEHASERLAALRRAHMRPEAVEALFGLEEEYARYTLDRMQIEMDPELGATDKAVLVAMLRDSLPEPLRASESRHAEEAERSQAIRTIIESSASPADKRAALSQFHDVETVDRTMRYLERMQARPRPRS